MCKKNNKMKSHEVFLIVEKRLVEIETPYDAPSFAFGLD